MPKRRDSRQEDILHFIYEHTKNRGFPPTVREIGEQVGLSSTSTVHGHLARMEKKGYLLRDSTKPRAMDITPVGLELIGVQDKEIPVVGTVAAGQPITATENIIDYFPIPPQLSNESAPLFILTIEGESMINAGILDGDWVIVRKQATANQGDIVIAMTDEDEATCKRFYKEDTFIRLEPENDSMEAIIVDNVLILGKVVGLYRPHIF